MRFRTFSESRNLKISIREEQCVYWKPEEQQGRWSSGTTWQGAGGSIKRIISLNHWLPRITHRRNTQAEPRISLDDVAKIEQRKQGDNIKLCLCPHIIQSANTSWFSIKPSLGTRFIQMSETWPFSQKALTISAWRVWGNMYYSSLLRTVGCLWRYLVWQIPKYKLKYKFISSLRIS